MQCACRVCALVYKGDGGGHGVVDGLERGILPSNVLPHLSYMNLSNHCTTCAKPRTQATMNATLALIVVIPQCMHEGYCSHSVCKCVSVTMLAAIYLFYTCTLKTKGAIIIRLFVVASRYELCGFH